MNKSFAGIMLAVFFTVISFKICAEGNDGNWRMHPTFDCSPVRIVDTPDMEYFLVNQQIYDRSVKYYDTTSMTVFCRNKKDKSDKIIPITYIADLASFDIRCIEYSALLNSLIIGYNNGNIDIVDSDGSVRNVLLAEEDGYPGIDNIRNIIVPSYSDKLMVCNDSGYCIVDGRNGRLIRKVLLGKPVDTLFQSGETVVMLMDGKIYFAKDDYPENMDSITSISELSSVLWAAPLDDHSFAFIKGATAASVQLMVADIKNDSLNIENICSDSFTAEFVNRSALSRYTGNFIPNKEGYLLYSRSKVWQLYKNETEKWDVRSISLAQAEYPLGSWDFTTFLTYRDRGGFLRRCVNNNGGGIEWTDMGESVRPEAPAAFICTQMLYSPDYGLLALNHGNEVRFPVLSYISPSLLSCWNGREWKLHSYSFLHDAPKEITTNPKYESVWRTYKDRYPLFNPTGFMVDPIDSDIAVLTSTFGGVTFQNLKNPEEIPIRICSPSDPLAGLPGSVIGFPDQNWTSFCALSAPSVDSDSTVWLCYVNLKGCKGVAEPTLQLKYMTKEKREEFYESLPDKQACTNLLGTIDVPYTQEPASYGKLMAFVNESSREYIIVDTQQWNRGAFILNHRSTLDNTADDEWKHICGYIDRTGRKIEFTQDWNMIEDPVNGNVIMAYYDGLATFHPSAEVTADGYIYGEDFTLTATGERILPSVCMVTNMTFDTFGRLWIATEDQGVVCLSADRERVEYRLTDATTPLPSDRVYGLGWNPEINSIMISTDSGLVEFTPDVITGNQVDKNISIYPDKVLPDYHGVVFFSNIPAYSSLTIRDKTGKEVVRLHSGSESVMTWDLKDKTDQRVSPGVYLIEHDGEVYPLELLVMSPL